jgi:hypothetical protein
VAARRHRGCLRDAVRRIAGLYDAGAQVDGAARRAEQIRVTVPKVGGDGKGGVALRKPLNTGRESGLPEFLQLLVLLALRELAGDLSDKFDARLFSSRRQRKPLNSNQAPVL